VLKSKTNINPATTGDMEKGKSIIVINMFFPLNLNFAIAQAAARPNMVLIGTVIAMVMRVSFMALVLSDR